MKKIINRKIYDTDTAELIHHWDNGMYGNDFRSCEESLYITKNGALFINGSGGPMSKYAEHFGNTTAGSSNIILLTKDEALDWLEQHDGTESIKKYFKEDIKED